MVIGRYRLRQVIGRGGSSIVYRAINADRPDLPSVVAIKVADDEQCGEPDFRRQFHEQSRVSSAVDHPSVLPVLDSGEHLGRPFLVMPYIHGADLARQLNAQALTVGRVLVLLRQVADGLDAMHGAGVLHLDVKPANVLVGRVYPGENSPSRTDTCVDAAYLTDLGLCRFLSDGRAVRPARGVGSTSSDHPATPPRSTCAGDRCDRHRMSTRWPACCSPVWPGTRPTSATSRPS